MRLEGALAAVIGFTGLLGLSFIAGRLGFLSNKKNNTVTNDTRQDDDLPLTKSSYVDLTVLSQKLS